MMTSKEVEKPKLTADNCWRIVTKNSTRMGKGPMPPGQVALKNYAEDQEEIGQGADKKTTDQKTDQAKPDQKETEEAKKAEKDKDEYYTSGVESDHDVDLLVEQEVLTAVRMRAQLKEQLRLQGKGDSDEEEETVGHSQVVMQEEQKQPVKKKAKPSLTKDEARRLWDNTLRTVPDDYTFVITTQ